MAGEFTVAMAAASNHTAAQTAPAKLSTRGDIIALFRWTELKLTDAS
jgi:hypothetical protein